MFEKKNPQLVGNSKKSLSQVETGLSDVDKGCENVTNLQKKTLSGMWMRAPVCQKCLLPAIFHCLLTHTRTQEHTALSFLSWLSCKTGGSDSSFPPKWDLLHFTSSIAKKNNFQWSQGSAVSRCKIAPAPGEAPPPQKKTEAVAGRMRGFRDNENWELF